MEEFKLEVLKKYANNPELIEKADLAEKEVYADCVIEGCEQNIPEALDIMAYACYGGNSVFECDWYKSEECFLKLIELGNDQNAFYHNSLGYIYFYGRCNNGEPEYDKAFKYFTIGALNGVYESVCKLSDMLVNGLGVPASPNAGIKLLLDIYQENLDIFCDEHFEGKFADLSVRLGRIFERDILNGQVDMKLAYAFYLRAKYAIELRRKFHENIVFDDRVEKKILTDFENAKAKLPDDFFIDKLFLEAPEPLGILLTGSVGLDIELFERAGEFYLRGVRYASENMPKNALIVYPELDYCKLVNEIVIRIIGFNETVIDEFGEMPARAFINEIVNDGNGAWEFRYGGKVMMKIECEGFEIRDKIN